MYSIFALTAKKEVHLQGCFVQWREGFVQWGKRQEIFLEEKSNFFPKNKERKSSIF